MTTKVIMPQMGESIFEGTITKWLKKVGERVNRDEPLFEISTDKVDSEIPAPASGILSQILVPEGQTVQINTVVAIINGAGAEERKSVIATPGVDIAAQEKPEEAAEEKSTSRPPVPEIEKPQPPATPLVAERMPQTGTAPSIRVQDIRTSPLVRKLARENNVDLSEIQGTGLDGRITKEDMLNYLAKRSGQAPEQNPAAELSTIEPEAPMPPPVSAAPPEPQRPAPAPSEVPRFAGETETVPMSPMRKAIAEHMVLSRRTSAHVSTVFEVDVTSVVQLREMHKAEFHTREGIPLTYSPFFAKALVETVREFPIMNASVSGDNIVYGKSINLGIAVALETGLIVPVIRAAHLKSFTGLALAIYDVADRARKKKLKPDDVQNGTISMTNPGNFGALFGTPIISQPQVAILGVGGIEKRPIVINDAIAIRSMVYLSLSFDHRVIDGAIADQFMARLKQRLQSWKEWMD